MSEKNAPDKRIEQLYQDMFYILYAYAFKIMAEPALAEEAVQNTFCIACEKASSLLTSGNPKGWLMNTLKYTIRNMQRDRAKLAAILLDTMAEVNRETADELDVNILYSDISHTDDFQLLRRIALDRYSLLEAAEELGISLDACQKRVQRARKRLQKKIQGKP